MNEIEEHKREFDRMRGEYLGLMASIELNLTFLLAEWLDIGRHRQEFQEWFVAASVPFRSKVRLYGSLTRGEVGQFSDLPERMREAYDFRNTLAHSFRDFGGVRTSKGFQVPDETISTEALERKLQELKRLENLVKSLWGWAIEGPPQRVFTDDYADWPSGIFLP